MAHELLGHLDHMNGNADEQRIVLFESADGEIELSVNVGEETVWLTQAQMAELFERSVAVISRHISNVFAEKELEKEGNLHFLQGYVTTNS